MKKSVLVLAVGCWWCLGLVACGGGKPKDPPSGLSQRVLASQGVTSAATFGGLVIINGYNDTLPRLAPINAGSQPGLMEITPTLNMVAAFDASSNNVYAVDTYKEAPMGSVHLAGPTTSFVLPTADSIGYAAVPAATVSGFSFTGAVQEMNFPTGSLTTTIAVQNAETVVSNQVGTQLLVFSNESDSITVLFPAIAVPPVDTSCFNPPNAVCVVVPEPTGSRPVNALVSGNTAYIFNCGYECGGLTSGGQPAPASIAIFDLTSLTVTGTIPVNGATFGFLGNSVLYVAGKGSPTGPLCASLTSSINPTTAATYCGTLDIVDLGTMTDPYFNSPSTEIAIPDGYHDRMDMSSNGQLFVGSYDCTNIGNVNEPSGEVRGCLAIYNTNNNSLIIPPDNGDVTGLQSFTTYYKEYVAEDGNLRVYDTVTDVLLINDYLPEGNIDIVGYVGDIKAIDSF